MCSLSFSLVADPRGWVLVGLGGATVKNGWTCYVAVFCFRVFFLVEDYGEYVKLRREGQK